MADENPWTLWVVICWIMWNCVSLTRTFKCCLRSLFSLCLCSSGFVLMFRGCGERLVILCFKHRGKKEGYHVYLLQNYNISSFSVSSVLVHLMLLTMVPRKHYTCCRLRFKLFIIYFSRAITCDRVIATLLSITTIQLNVTYHTLQFPLMITQSGLLDKSGGNHEKI